MLHKLQRLSTMLNCQLSSVVAEIKVDGRERSGIPS
jgi:hypothetical protein